MQFRSSRRKISTYICSYNVFTNRVSPWIVPFIIRIVSLKFHPKFSLQFRSSSTVTFSTETRTRNNQYNNFQRKYLILYNYKLLAPICRSSATESIVGDRWSIKGRRIQLDRLSIYAWRGEGLVWKTIFKRRNGANRRQERLRERTTNPRLEERGRDRTMCMLRMSPRGVQHLYIRGIHRGIYGSPFRFASFARPSRVVYCLITP